MMNSNPLQQQPGGIPQQQQMQFNNQGFSPQQPMGYGGGMPQQQQQPFQYGGGGGSTTPAGQQQVMYQNGAMQQPQMQQPQMQQSQMQHSQMLQTQMQYAQMPQPHGTMQQQPQQMHQSHQYAQQQQQQQQFSSPHGYHAAQMPQQTGQNFHQAPMPQPQYQQQQSYASHQPQFQQQSFAGRRSGATMRPPFIDPNTQIIYDVDNPEYEGWLTKQSDWLKEWRRRYFILKGNKLFFGKNPHSAPHGMMDLAVCTTVKSADLKSKRENSFEISTPETCYLLFADTEGEKDDWIGRVGKAIVRSSRTFEPGEAGADDEDEDDIYENDDENNPYYND